MPDPSNAIVRVREQSVMMDGSLAALYGVETRTLLQAIKRNIERFPADFCFQLTPAEAANLKSQVVMSSPGWGGRRTRPYAFTEQGVAMLSSVLRTRRAVAVNIEIMRAFVRLRHMFTANKELALQLAALEERIDKRLLKQDQTIVEILKAIRVLMGTSPQPGRPIGFVTENKGR